MIFLLQHLNWSAILRFFPTFLIVFATLYIPAWLLCYVDRRYFGGKKLKPKARYCMFIASIEMGIMISLACLLKVAEIRVIDFWIPIHLVYVFACNIIPTWMNKKGFTRDNFVNYGAIDVVVEWTTQPIYESIVTLFLSLCAWGLTICYFTEVLR